MHKRKRGNEYEYGMYHFIGGDPYHCEDLLLLMFTIRGVSSIISKVGSGKFPRTISRRMELKYCGVCYASI